LILNQSAFAPASPSHGLIYSQDTTSPYNLHQSNTTPFTGFILLHKIRTSPHTTSQLSFHAQLIENLKTQRATPLMTTHTTLGYKLEGGPTQNTLPQATQIHATYIPTKKPWPTTYSNEPLTLSKTSLSAPRKPHASTIGKLELHSSPEYFKFLVQCVTYNIHSHLQFLFPGNNTFKDTIISLDSSQLPTPRQTSPSSHINSPLTLPRASETTPPFLGGGRNSNKPFYPTPQTQPPPTSSTHLLQLSTSAPTDNPTLDLWQHAILLIYPLKLSQFSQNPKKKAGTSPCLDPSRLPTLFIPKIAHFTHGEWQTLHDVHIYMQGLHKLLNIHLTPPLFSQPDLDQILINELPPSSWTSPRQFGPTQRYIGPLHAPSMCGVWHNGNNHFVVIFICPGFWTIYNRHATERNTPPNLTMTTKVWSTQPKYV